MLLPKTPKKTKVEIFAEFEIISGVWRLKTTVNKRTIIFCYDTFDMIYFNGSSKV